MDPETRQGKDIVPIRGNKLNVQDQDGKLRNIFKKTYLNRWIGNTIDFGRSAVESRFINEGNISGRKTNNGMEFARFVELLACQVSSSAHLLTFYFCNCALTIVLPSVFRVKIENATLKESLESMEHLTTSIHRLRISLSQVVFPPI